MLLKSNAVIVKRNLSFFQAQIQELCAAGISRRYTEMQNTSLAANIFVDKTILSFLNMSNYDRKARLLIPIKSYQITSINQLRDIVEVRLESLKNQPYKLRYRLLDDNTSSLLLPTLLTDDDEVVHILDSIKTADMKLQLYIDVNPGIFPPNSISNSNDYLCGMRADPSITDTFTMLSFYKFAHIENVSEFIAHLHQLWKPFMCYGRVYIATEGVNAQMAVPTNILTYFQRAIETVPIFKDVKLNTDHRITREEFELTKPFKTLHIRQRKQIVVDGFTDNQSVVSSAQQFNETSASTSDLHTQSDINNSNNVKHTTQSVTLDFNSNTGKEVDPLDWHTRIDNKNNIVLDCRNKYESDIGIFDNAIPLNTEVFSDSWTALDDILRDKPKDTPILTYCTGGIRCVKINAYLQQKLGFQNTGRLKGGIISYTRQLELMSSSAITGGVINCVNDQGVFLLFFCLLQVCCCMYFVSSRCTCLTFSTLFR